MKSKKDPANIEQQINALKDEFTAKLKKIDPDLIPQLRIIQGIKHGSHFSDWHDNWNDGGRWVKTWGKAGGDSILNDPGIKFDLNKGDIFKT